MDQYNSFSTGRCNEADLTLVCANSSNGQSQSDALYMCSKSLINVHSGTLDCGGIVGCHLQQTSDWLPPIHLSGASERAEFSHWGLQIEKEGLEVKLD